MKWYTAIGVKVNYGDGKFHVCIGKEEKVLSGMEISLWTSLLWAFIEEKDIYNRMNKLIALTFPEEKKKINQDDFRYCIHRLCIRGLVISCEKETKEAAVAETLRKSTVEMTVATFHDRYINFLNSAVHGNGVRFSLRVFQKTPLEKQHKGLLEQIRRQGEVSAYLKGIQQEGREAGWTEKESKHRQEEFLNTVIELYSKKILLIRTVNRGGTFE